MSWVCLDWVLPRRFTVRHTEADTADARAREEDTEDACGRAEDTAETPPCCVLQEPAACRIQSSYRLLLFRRALRGITARRHVACRVIQRQATRLLQARFERLSQAILRRRGSHAYAALGARGDR